MDVGTLRRYVRDQLEVDDEELPDTLLNVYLQDAFERTMAFDSRWPRYEATWQIVSLPGADSVDLPAEASLPGITSVLSADGYRLVQMNHELAEDFFAPVTTVQLGTPVYYSLWAGKLYLWPKPTSTEFAYDMQLRGYRQPVWTSGASDIPDLDPRCHLALAYYAISLAYAQQEDEVLEGVYIARWQRDLAQQLKVILKPTHHRPLVMHGGNPIGGGTPYIVNVPQASDMTNRLEPINLMTFVGGLNLRRNQFELADDESPDMLNVDVDPRGGFYTRHGWQRWNDDDIVDPTLGTWEPRNAWVHTASDGTQFVYVVNAGTVFRSDNTALFAPVSAISAVADPHGADFTAWGDDIYIAAGRGSAGYRVNLLGVATALSATSWSEVDAPVHGTMPKAEYITTHAGYVFVAVTNEADGYHYGRIRWSHPGEPDCWRQTDYLDVDAGGGKITGILAFNDHLLIFKTSTMWALYGYDEDSWQLVQVSSKTGCPTITAVSRSETATYFYSATDQGGIYMYTGDQPVYMSEALRPAFEEVTNFENVFVSWAGRRLWVGVPWVRGIGSTVDPTSTFVYDPDIGRGAWTMYRSNVGSLGLVIDNSDISSKFPLALFWSSSTACLVMLEYIDDPYDVILEAAVLGTESSLPDSPDAGFIVTGADEDIGIVGDFGLGSAFDSYYRTRWLHAGWPDRKKSWRRPTFICREVPRDTDLIVETYRDYNETAVHRTRTLRLQTKGSAYWTLTGADEPEAGGFDWTPGGSAEAGGADWGAAQAGSTIVRGGSQGLARSIQMRVRASPNTQRQRWGVDGIVAKIVQRRFR